MHVRDACMRAYVGGMKRLARGSGFAGSDIDTVAPGGGVMVAIRTVGRHPRALQQEKLLHVGKAAG